ncbi:hypothetical protein TNCV_1683241 [Trichonephila clavipes]|nr:hypothetical protein TNCV_1683241 [Trichonephila clavipes]
MTCLQTNDMIRSLDHWATEAPSLWKEIVSQLFFKQLASRIACSTETIPIRKEDTTPWKRCPVSLQLSKRCHRWSSFERM